MLIVERYLIIQIFHLLKSIASVETFLWLYFISTHKNVTFIYSFKTFCIDYITPCMFQKFESTKSAFCPLPSPLPSPPQEEAHFWAWTVPTWAKALLRVALVIVLIVDNAVHLVSFKHAPWHSFHGGIQSTASCTPMAAALGTEGHPVICLSSLSWQMFRLFLTFCYSIYSEDLRTYILLHVWVKCRVNGFVTDQWKPGQHFSVQRCTIWLTLQQSTKVTVCAPTPHWPFSSLPRGNQSHHFLMTWKYRNPTPLFSRWLHTCLHTTYWIIYESITFKQYKLLNFWIVFKCRNSSLKS